MIDAATAAPQPGPDAPPSGVPGNPGILGQFGAPSALRFGDYLLEEEVAHGGMGVIYRAKQLSLGRTVAVKMLLLGRYSSAESIDRFRREAHSAASLRHPNIVAIYEVGEWEGQHFFSMEFVDGPSLGAISRQGPLKPQRAVEYARAIAEAIDYAHTQGVLHRDLKPSNVLIDPFDQVRITDFGLAKKLDGSSDLTLTGQMIGSPNYLSPEQAAGKQAQIGPPSDIYGIGALLYELLTGRPPFMAESLQDTLLHIRETDPVPPAVLNPAVPRDLSTITLKCLEKVPARRYASARALAEDLRRFLHHEPISARPISMAERIWKTIRRHRIGTALAGTALLSLLCLTAGSLWFGVRVDRARAETEAANRRLARNLFVREWQDAEQLVDEGKTHSALIWFARVVRQNPADLVATTRLLELLGNETFSVPAGRELAHPGSVGAADFSADGRRLVTGAVDGKVRVWAWREATSPQVLTNQFDNTLAAKFIPEDGRLLVADNHMISLWSEDGVLEQAVTNSIPGGLRWSITRDGLKAMLVSPGEPQLWEPHTLRLLGRLNQGDPNRPATALSRDGRYVLRSVAPQEAPGAAIWDLTTGRRVWWFRLPEAPPLLWLYSGAFSDDNQLVALSFWNEHSFVCHFNPRSEGEPDQPTLEPPLAKIAGPVVEDFHFFGHNRRIVVASGGGGAKVWDLERGEWLPGEIEHFGGINNTCVSPDGTTLAAASMDGRVRFWDLRRDQLKPLVLNQYDEVWDVAFSPDSSWFVMSGNPNAEVHDTRTGALLHELPMSALVSCVKVSPDGRRIAVSTEGGLLRVWDSASGAPITPLVRMGERIHDLTFSADGRWLCVGPPESRAWILDAETGKAVFPPFVANSALVRVILTPDQQTLIGVTTQGELNFWSLDGRRKPVGDRHKGIIWTARLSGDGQLLATASSDQTARIWEVASGALRREFRSEKDVYNAVFSPDGRRVLVGSADGSARIIETASGRQVPETMLHKGGVWFCEFSPDGRVVLTGDDSGAARLWDAETGLPLGNWLRSGASLKCAHFSPDGRHVATGSKDHTVKLWPVSIAPARCPSWVWELAEGIAGRRLADDGTIQTVPFEAWQGLRDKLVSLSDDGFYSRWARWFFGSDRDRPVESDSAR
jgi:WD40 repeat protein